MATWSEIITRWYPSVSASWVQPASESGLAPGSKLRRFTPSRIAYHGCRCGSRSRATTWGSASDTGKSLRAMVATFPPRRTRLLCGIDETPSITHLWNRRLEESMRPLTSTAIVVFAALLSSFGPAAAAPEGTLTWGVHVTLPPRWLDPAEVEGINTPFMVIYALHDALVKPMPGRPYTPSLAESVTQSNDGLTYARGLRKAARLR